MRPGSNGEIILEGSKDRRYARKGIRLLGNISADAHLSAREQTVHFNIYRDIYLGLSEKEVADARRTDFTLNYRFTAFKGEDSARTEEATRRAREEFYDADVPLSPEFTQLTLGGLQAIVELSKIDAMRNLVHRPVAEEMLEDFQGPHQRTETNS